MLKFLSGIALRYAVFIRYKNSIIRIIGAIGTVVLAYFLHADVVEFLKDTESSECTAYISGDLKAKCIDKIETYRIYALLIKWLLIVLALILIIYTVNPVVKPRPETKKKAKPLKDHEAKYSPRINKIMGKDHLESEADKIWKKLKHK